MLDFGSGALSGLQRYGDMRRVDAILLSHLHCDHMLGACDYVVIPALLAGGPVPAAAGVCAGPVARSGWPPRNWSPEEGPLDDVYEFRTLSAGTFDLGPFTITSDGVNHPVETYGVRLNMKAGC